MEALWLITPSLYSSWYYYRAIETKTQDDFINVLNKVKTEQNQRMLDGIRFEDDIVANINGIAPQGTESYVNCVEEIAKLVKGSFFQVKCYKEAKIGGVNFLLYGRADAVCRQYIGDIKYVEKYDLGKYESSIQHLLYCYALEMNNFKYLISDGNDCFIEDYVRNDTLLFSRVSDMYDDIMYHAQFREPFMKNWKAR